MPRHKTTGRCETREELVRQVWDRYLNTPAGSTDIAKALHVSAGTVHNILNKAEGKPTEGPLVKKRQCGRRPGESARTKAKAAAFAKAFRQGKTSVQIGRDHGCSREYVRQLLKRQGLTGKDGGRAVKQAQREAA